MPNDTAPVTLVMDEGRAAYDAIEAVNWSTLKVIGRSPLHFQHAKKTPGKDTPARRKGRLGHLAVLERDLFRKSIAVWEGGRKQGKAFDAFEEANAGREVLSQKELDEINLMAAMVRTDPAAKKYLTGGSAEVTATWTRDVKLPDGSATVAVKCKGRLDYVAQAVVDLKTTRDASPDGFAREVWRYGYHTQAAWYVDGYAAATGRELPAVLIAVESEAPHVVAVYRIPDDILQMGREHYESLLARYAECSRENRWPGYFIGESELTLPRYAYPLSADEKLDDVGLDFGAEE